MAFPYHGCDELKHERFIHTSHDAKLVCESSLLILGARIPSASNSRIQFECFERFNLGVIEKLWKNHESEVKQPS